MNNTHIYKSVNGRDIELLFFPPTAHATAHAPLLIVIPGGGWRLSRAQSMYDMERAACEALRGEGFAVAALSYRNAKDDGVNMRQMVADVFDGAAYLADHAQGLSLDPTRFYTSGHSAGGHLALLLAYAPCDFLAAERVCHAPFTVRATAPLSPPTVLPQGDGAPYLHFSVDDLFAGCAAEDYRLFSPQTFADEGRAVPTLVAVGEQDDLVYPANGKRLAETVAALGLPAVCIAAQNGGHAFEPIGAERPDPDFGEIQRRIVAFLLEADRSR